jgi:RNA polymerase sigma-70 factor, ECF subfamily
MVFDEHAAEDIFQEVSIAAISKCSQIADVEHFLPWVRQAARFQSLTTLRSQKKLPMSLSSELLEVLESHWQKFDNRSENELSTALKTCLQTLGPYAQQLIEKRYIEGKSGNGLAQALEKSVNTVYVALTRVHNALRDCVKKQLILERGNG